MNHGPEETPASGPSSEQVVHSPSLFDQESAGGPGASVSAGERAGLDEPPGPVEQEQPPPAGRAPGLVWRAEPEPGPGVRVRMKVAYDGSGYRGFAANPGVRTVGGELAGALERVLGHGVALTCAGRTDAGVHAWGQVVHFDTPSEPDLVSLQRSLNKMLGPSVVVRAADLAAPGFDARRSATGRRYRYTVLNRPLPDPFLASTTWHVDEPLDLRAMTLACDPLIGRHDWSSFCKRPAEPEPDATLGPHSLVRVVREARWADLGMGVLRFEIEASAFCHQMVRSVVGTLVAVGRGRRRAGDIGGLIRARDRSRASEPAPPHGLCLWRVSYDVGGASAVTAAGDGRLVSGS